MTDFCRYSNFDIYCAASSIDFSVFMSLRQFYLNLCDIYFFVSIGYYVLLSALLFCCLSFTINFSCVLFQFCVELYFIMYKLFGL